MRLMLLLTFMFVSSPTWADSVESAVSITEKECRKLIRINSFSSADYKAGVDMRGNKVVGADLNGGHKIKLPDEITFDFGIDLAEKYNMGTGFYGKANLGKVKVKGRNVYWNGQKLGQDENNAILDACLAQYGQK
ncbi:conserved exported hypothetical protein [Candidatus Terasakiella magnetica]|uniref:Uncharacterized protein n=1 Tax=Candidatus Terasakiella magnetica TaxID=1867952 RepID=A0A1C3RCK4_9PROT|nr:hypothetical protein [Candidatus Terasakiella magnetica]SCA55009.1 conserved exported hypothetical protein [Candidatus Terasakiella magnetica]